MSLMNVCVAPCRCVCLADCSMQSSDIPPDSSELFTVPGLSESERERERGGREKGEGKTTSEGGDGVRSLSVRGDSTHACMFWRSKVSARSPINTW